MTEQQVQDTAEIESLLASRQKILDWLQRLDQAGSTTPASVRERVRKDYHGRLAEVVNHLRAHSTSLTETVTGLRREFAELERVRTEEEEALSEAELRHAVGEYSDEEWATHEETTGTKLESLGAEIHRVSSEIHRLAEVLGLISPAEPEPEPQAVVSRPIAHKEDAAIPAMDGASAHPSAVEAYAKPVEAEAPLLREVVSAVEPTAPSAPPEAPRFVPRSGRVPNREGPLGRTIPFPVPPHAPPSTPPGDELAFLKSVTIDAAPAATSHRAAAPTVHAKETSPLRGGERPSQSVSKTLKCTDCGTMNRPTEWYCERCGAELATL